MLSINKKKIFLIIAYNNTKFNIIYILGLSYKILIYLKIKI